MKINNLLNCSALIGFICLFNTAAIAQIRSVTVTDIRSEKGQLIINVFKDSKSYEKEVAFKKFQFDKKAVINGKMTINFALEPGVYGITLIDDENRDNELNKNIIGIPKEGFGFSNFFMSKMKKPDFEDFKVDLRNKENKISIQVKYM
ncbi:DUF2141 domain-containing protein [Flavobacterium sp. MC2016-06]|uniref:DUF2141 domain-containing protein n=1 Tax=Flavobacterium sp. MC2016-06 TaxID=2676308 RepID=UPI0012BAC7B9|nr:DUF2141 domain-containing protein [Flavobacterium sp. MC2016-06]MBU3857638.1 DUF2141 domain-containing protein [Flavobacterium sp. MC2016-06]